MRVHPATVATQPGSYSVVHTTNASKEPRTAAESSLHSKTGSDHVARSFDALVSELRAKIMGGAEPFLVVQRATGRHIGHPLMTNQFISPPEMFLHAAVHAARHNGVSTWHTGVREAEQPIEPKLPNDRRASSPTRWRPRRPLSPPPLSKTIRDLTLDRIARPDVAADNNTILHFDSGAAHQGTLRHSSHSKTARSGTSRRPSHAHDTLAASGGSFLRTSGPSGVATPITTARSTSRRFGRSGAARPSAQTGYMPGYSGYVPRLQHVAGRSFTRSTSRAMRKTVTQLCVSDSIPADPAESRRAQLRMLKPGHTTGGHVPGYNGHVRGLRDRVGEAYDRATATLHVQGGIHAKAGRKAMNARIGQSLQSNSGTTIPMSPVKRG